MFFASIIFHVELTGNPLKKGYQKAIDLQKLGSAPI